MKETLERICAILDNGKELIGDSATDSQFICHRLLYH